MAVAAPEQARQAELTGERLVLRSFQLPTDLDEWLREAAFRRRTPAARLIRDAIRRMRAEEEQGAALQALVPGGEILPTMPDAETMQALEEGILATPVGAALAKMAAGLQVSGEAQEELTEKMKPALPLLAALLACLLPALGNVSIPEGSDQK